MYPIDEQVALFLAHIDLWCKGCDECTEEYRTYMTQQIMLATTGDNLWCTGVATGHDPRYSPTGLDECVRHWVDSGRAHNYANLQRTLHATQ